jgi:ATP-dependent helicase/nuclease subunit A
MRWTDSQLEAVETRGRRIIVSAGAGSGKTRVLVERFLRLLEENASWRVADIVAVTFTEKAAREMVSRIRRSMRARIERSSGIEEARRWRKLRNELDSARIGTIHSLCASILRANPAEAGLDPAFQVLEEIETAALAEQAIEEALGALVESGLPELEIFSYLTPHELKQSLRYLLSRGEQARRAAEALAGKSAADILAFWQHRLACLRAQAALALVENSRWQSDARTITRLKGEASDRREQCRAEVAGLLARAASIVDGSQGEIDGAALADTLSRIAAAINLVGGSKKKWPSEEDFFAVRDALKRLRESVKEERLLSLCLNEADEAASRAVARLSSILSRARERFSSLKSDKAALDFNDLEEKAESLLSAREDVRRGYGESQSGGIRALMIDEFQDTAPIQARILRMLAPASQEVFIIGDAKQSIYRFRGADVTVFDGARREFVESGGREVPMDTCFRTHTRLVAFVNQVFPEIFARESRYDTPYESMKARRLPAHEDPAVEIHVFTQGSEDEARIAASEMRRAEASFIARRVKEIVEGGGLVVCEGEGETRRAAYGDFTLLFQASTNFEIYEQALADAEVPYSTIAGRGFYDRQEITDLTNLLAFLVNPGDSLRLASALRSPLFGISDETLLRLRLKPQPLWRALLDESIEHEGSEREAVLFAGRALKRLRDQAGRIATAELIISALRETGYIATLQALPHGERRTANVEKFIEQSRALSRMTLDEIVDRTMDLKFREAREGEAAAEESGAVRLMTVHKSKGLEFPVVWIADATYKGASERGRVALHREVGIAIDIKAEALDLEDESLRASSFEMIRQVEDREDRAERKRLLYVAATRARDHLIISGSLTRARASGDHWLGRVLAALGVVADEMPEEASYDGGSVQIGWHEALQSLSEIDQNLHDRGAGESFAARVARLKALAQTTGEPAASLTGAFPLIRPLN